MNRDKIYQTLTQIVTPELLAKAKKKDVVANGIQFSGGDNVTKIATGVSLNAQFLEKAIEWGAQMCIFHHAFDPRTEGSLYSQSSQKRLRLIIENNLSIIGLHYVLDAHPTLSNNAQIAQKIGATITNTLYEEWGFVAQLPQEMTLAELETACRKLFQHTIFTFPANSDPIQTIGIVSGAGKPVESHMWEMKQKGVEAYISGEGSESVPHKMMENGISYLLGGHYATEVFGVQALGAALQKTLGNEVGVQFIDVNNPL
ncbi:MAG: Nif3-like dinuclear metal center hexameric protein [Pseudomonadales bacterium]|nr:Nif3-like dinuclear metal center hexameric protein [Candidatus Woesebacteria bacterium]MCB9801548.1 Nif3-like dinuclear metal center hexameric protein [Pseudomonadales bacterium]